MHLSSYPKPALTTSRALLYSFLDLDIQVHLWTSNERQQNFSANNSKQDKTVRYDVEQRFYPLAILISSGLQEGVIGDDLDNS